MRVLLAVTVLALATSGARAETVWSCTGSTGHAYVLPGGVVPSGSSGWMEDRLSEGKILLNRDEDGYDVVYEDDGGSRSAKAAGGVVAARSGTPEDSLIIVIEYPGAIEIFQFASHQGRRELVWTQNKRGDIVSKAGVFRSDCD